MKASQVLTGEFNRHKSVQQTCSHVLDYLVSMLYNGSKVIITAHASPAKSMSKEGGA